MDLGDALRVVRHGRWWLVVLTLAGLAVAAVGTGSSTPLYSSSTQLLVSATAWAGVPTAYEGDLYAKTRAASFAQVLESEQLARRVVDELGLDATPAEVARQVRSTLVPRATVLEVTVTDTSPERARDIAASLARQFTRWATEASTSTGTATTPFTVSTLGEAEVEPDPVTPDTARDLGLGGALGLLAGLLAALLRHGRATDVVTTEDDVRAGTGSGLLGTVPEDPALAAGEPGAAPAEHAATAEALRAVRTTVQLLDVPRPCRVVVVSGVHPGDGASTLAVRLATALADAGGRVTLVEADATRPVLADRLQLAPGPGLTDVLAGTATLAGATRAAGTGPAVVPAGRAIGELLDPAGLRAVLAELRLSQDHVVLDAPPALTGPQAAELTALADGCVLAVRAGRTRPADLAAAAEGIAIAGGRVLGTVLTRQAPPSGRARARVRRYRADRARGGEPVTVERRPQPVGRGGGSGV